VAVGSSHNISELRC